MNSKKISISVVVATYNGEKYIQDQIFSILRQSRVPDEIIISDDCSTDKTIELVEDILSSAKVKYSILKSDLNRGYAQNFNQGLLASSGDLVFLCDQDDVWLPNKIDVCAANFYADVDLIMHDMCVSNDTLDILHPSFLQSLKSAGGVADHFCSGCAMAVSRRLLSVALPIPSGILDHDVWILEVAKFFGKKIILPDKLSIYRRHLSSTTSNSFISKSLYLRLAVFYNSEKSGYFLKRRICMLKNILEIYSKCNMVSTNISLDQIKYELRLTIQRVDIKSSNVIRRLLSFNFYLSHKLSILAYIKDCFFSISKCCAQHILD